VANVTPNTAALIRISRRLEALERHIRSQGLELTGEIRRRSFTTLRAVGATRSRLHAEMADLRRQLRLLQRFVASYMAQQARTIRRSQQKFLHARSRPARPPSLRKDLLEGQLGARARGAQKILETLRRHPERRFTSAELAALLGYKPAGGFFKSIMAALRREGFVRTRIEEGEHYVVIAKPLEVVAARLPSSRARS